MLRVTITLLFVWYLSVVLLYFGLKVLPVSCSDVVGCTSSAGAIVFAQFSLQSPWLRIRLPLQTQVDSHPGRNR